MRVEDFLETLNTSIEHYAHWIKIFIVSIGILIAYNYFFVPSLVLIGVGVPLYLYFRVYRRDLVDKVFVSAPAPAPASPPTPVPETTPTLQT